MRKSPGWGLEDAVLVRLGQVVLVQHQAFASAFSRMVRIACSTAAGGVGPQSSRARVRVSTASQPALISSVVVSSAWIACAVFFREQLFLREEPGEVVDQVAEGGVLRLQALQLGVHLVVADGVFGNVTRRPWPR